MSIYHKNYIVLQTINNCRSKKYALCNFDKGYPVATGIGTIAGGCCVEIIALKGNNLDLVPIGNKRQIDAHRYSENVLIGNQPGLDNKTTPKFERAKLVNNSEISVLLVSGTASIIGEKTVCIDDAAGQTVTTIENIQILLKSSIQSCDFSRYKLLNYRTYVKNYDDVDAIQKICSERFPNSPGIILISDICRDDLLVEIECNYLLHN